MGTRCMVMLCVVVLCACSSLNGRLESNSPAPLGPDAGIVPNLNALTQLDAALPRITATLHPFAVGDMVEAEFAAFDGPVLTLERPALSYAILGADVGALVPTQLSLRGSCDGLWVGISDFERESWRWIGENLTQAGDLTLGNGHWTKDGRVYFALVCPAGDAAEVELSLSLGADGSGVWNFMVWIAGDTGLATSAYADLQELEAVGSTGQVNLLAGYEINPDYLKDEVGGIDQAHYIQVVPDGDPLAVNLNGSPHNRVFSRAGFNSSDPLRLADFVDWADTNFPCDHRVLVLRGEGNGWLRLPHPPPPPGKSGARAANGVLQDNTEGNEWDCTPNSDVVAALTGRHFDLIIFDADNMASLEALYEYRGLADWLLASEMTIPEAGLPYTAALQAWQAAYPLPPQEVARTLSGAALEYYAAASIAATYTVVDASQLDGAATALSSLADTVAAAPDDWRYLHASMANLYQTDDLPGFLTAYLGLSQSPVVRASLGQVSTALAGALYSFDFVDPGQSYFYGLEKARGISILLPRNSNIDEIYYGPYFDQVSAEYAPLPFNQDTNWLGLFETAGVPQIYPAPVLTRWEPGDKLRSSWINPLDPDLKISLLVSTPAFEWGEPGNAGYTGGTLAFSQDSSVSRICTESCELLAGAPAGLYGYTCGGASPDEVLLFRELRRPDESIKLSFEPALVSYASGTGMSYVVYNDGSVGEAGWEPGDRLELAWDDAGAVFTIWLHDPTCKSADSDNPYPLAGKAEFSPPSYESGETRVWARLLAGAPGLYVVMAEYQANNADPPPAEITVSVKLYDAVDALKQDLGTLSFEGEMLDVSQPAAVLTYSTP